MWRIARSQPRTRALKKQVRPFHAGKSCLARGASAAQRWAAPHLTSSIADGIAAQLCRQLPAGADGAVKARRVQCRRRALTEVCQRIHALAFEGICSPRCAQGVAYAINIEEEESSHAG